MKCRDCNIELNLENTFPSYLANYNYICKSCHLRNSQKYRIIHRDRCNEYAREWRMKNLEKCRKWSAVSQRKHMKDLRLELFRLLDKKCNNLDCPIPRDKLDSRSLQLDHINGGGREERRNMHDYRKYIEAIINRIKEGSKEYQLLCPYCNWMKRYWNKEIEYYEN